MALKKSSKTFTVTDESENSYGLVVETKGGKIEDFLKNPVCLFNHNYDKVIGLWEDLKTVQDIMTGVPTFDENDEEAMKVYQKVEDGIIKGCSIGITALAWDGNRITEWLLKEITITPLPSNKNAVVLYDNQGIKLNDDQAKQFLLSLKTTTPTVTNQDNKMNENQKKALIALALQMGLTLMLSDSDERFNDVVEKATQKIKDLNDQLTKQGDNQAIALVDQAIADNKITADDKDFYLNAAKADYPGTAKMIGKLQAVNLNINQTLENNDGGAGGGKTPNAADPRKDWSFTDWSKNDSNGLYKMQFSDMPKFKALYKAEYGAEYEG